MDDASFASGTTFDETVQTFSCSSLGRPSEAGMTATQGATTAAGAGGRSPPFRGRTMKEYEEMLAQLRKENFNLKLRLYFLEERGGALGDGSGGEAGAAVRAELEQLRREAAEKQQLLCEAARAVELLEEQHQEQLRAARAAAHQAQAEAHHARAAAAAAAADAQRARQVSPPPLRPRRQAHANANARARALAVAAVGSAAGCVAEGVVPWALAAGAGAVSGRVARRVAGPVAGRVTKRVAAGVSRRLLGCVAGRAAGGLAAMVVGQAAGRFVSNFVGRLVGGIVDNLAGNVVWRKAGNLFGRVNTLLARTAANRQPRYSSWPEID